MYGILRIYSCIYHNLQELKPGELIFKYKISVARIICYIYALLFNHYGFRI